MRESDFEKKKNKEEERRRKKKKVIVWVVGKNAFCFLKKSVVTYTTYSLKLRSLLFFPIVLPI